MLGGATVLPQASNQRDFFRVALAEHPATMQVLEVGQRPVTTDAKPVRIIDASGSGLCILAQDDLQIRRGVVALFEFELMGYLFSFRGTFVRKLDDLRRFEYGVRFIDVDESLQGKLISILGRLQVQRQRGAVN